MKKKIAVYTNRKNAYFDIFPLLNFPLFSLHDTFPLSAASFPCLGRLFSHLNGSLTLTPFPPLGTRGEISEHAIHFLLNRSPSFAGSSSFNWLKMVFFFFFFIFVVIFVVIFSATFSILRKRCLLSFSS